MSLSSDFYYFSFKTICGPLFEGNVPSSSCYFWRQLSLYIYMHFWHFSSDVEIHGYLCQRTEWWIWSDSWTCGWISLNSFENFFAVMCSSSALASFLPPVFPGVLLYVWMINSLYSFYPYYFHPYFTLWVCLNIFFCCMF